MPSLGRLGDVVVNVRASTAKLRGDLANARAQTRNSLSGLAGSAKIAVLAAGTALASGVTAILMKGVTNFFETVAKGAQIKSWAEAIGDSVENVSVDTAVAEIIGVDPEALIDGIISMQQVLGEALEGDEGALRLLQRLGLNLEDLKHMTPTEQFWAFVHALQEIEDPAERAKLAAQLFGEDGLKELAPLLSLSADELERLRKKVLDLGLGFTETQAQMSRDILELWNTIKARISQPFTLGSTSMLPVVLGILVALDKQLQDLTAKLSHFMTVVAPKAVQDAERVAGTVQRALDLLSRLPGASGFGEGIRRGAPTGTAGAWDIGMMIGGVLRGGYDAAQRWQKVQGMDTSGSTVNIHYGDVYGVDDFNDRVNEGIRQGDRSGLPRARGNN